MKRLLLVVLMLGLIALISSCSLLGLGMRDEIQASLAAGALLDYVAAEGVSQVQELDTVGETYNLVVAGSPDLSSRAITEDTRVFEFPNVTVTITRQVDDMDTSTPTDDVVTVTRTEDYGFEADRIRILVRPLKPTTSAEWDSYSVGETVHGWAEDPVNSITQNGTIENLLGDVGISSGEVEATWAREGEVIFAEQIVRETSNVVRPNVVHRSIVSQTVDGETSITREREVDGEVVHSFTVEPYEDPDTGDILTKIVRDDGGYAIVRQRGNRAGTPRIVEYYNTDDVLVMIVEERSVFAAGTVESTRTFYGPDGEVTGTRVVTYSINYMEGEEDSVQVTRTVNGRTRIVTITESGEVYVVTMGGESYRIQVVDADTVEFLDDEDNVYMTAERTAEGAWEITGGGETVIV